MDCQQVQIHEVWITMWVADLDEYTRTIEFFEVGRHATDRARRNLDTAIADVRRELNLT